MKRILTCIALALCATAVFAQAEKIRLYEGKAPGSENWTQPEYLFEYTTSFNPGEVGQCILNVVDPELWAYLPAKGTETGAAVIVCPGGGFTALSWHQEGPNVARWLAAHGIAAFVLKYRIAYSGADYEEAKYVVDHSYGNQGRDARMRELTESTPRLPKSRATTGKWPGTMPGWRFPTSAPTRTSTASTPRPSASSASRRAATSSITWRWTTTS